MLPSATILNILNTTNGIQHLEYLSFLKKIFIAAAGGLTTLGNANGAAILALTNQLSNEEFAYQDSLDPIWTLFGAALVTLGHAANAAVINNYLKQSGRQQITWKDQVIPLIQAIQQGLATSGQ